MSISARPRLMIFYDHFYPAYKAGGPIQSLINLTVSLQKDYEVFVMTSAYDLNEDKMLRGVQKDAWIEIVLPQSAVPVKVWYAGNNSYSLTRKLIKEIAPGFIYLNGMFSYRFVLIPLLASGKEKMLICPRGMLQQGALAGKAFKKRIYLAMLKISGLCKKACWHATNAEEKRDIRSIFGEHSKVIVAGNIPKKTLEKISLAEKREEQLNLIYLSLITTKKNLLQLVSIIASMNENISLDIYGPVKDEEYWKKCLELINKTNGKINYRGAVMPENVQDTFSKYNASVLLTKGENFGHALYESLSAGRPVITSYFTPWNQLTEMKAGWNVDISDDNKISELLKQLYHMDASSFNQFYPGAQKLAEQYYTAGFDISSYKKLFS